MCKSQKLGKKPDKKLRFEKQSLVFFQEVIMFT